MSRNVRYAPHKAHVHEPLRLRGDVAHTFGPLIAPLAIVLVSWGFYLLASAVAHPLTADSVSLILASIVLALGFVLLSFLLRTTMVSRRLARAARACHRETPAKQPDLPPLGVEQDSHSEAVLPFHRSYVDSARVRR